MTNGEAQIARFVQATTCGASGAAARRAVFVAVRDLPYATDAGADAAALVQLGRGNCLAKADLLMQCLRLLGHAAHRVRWRYHLPAQPTEVALLPSRDDIRTATEVNIGGCWVLVDATHDPPLACGGFVVSEWDGEHPTAPAYAPCGPVWREGADDAAIAAALAAIVDQYQPTTVAESAYRRAFNTWLEQLRAGG